MLLQKITVVTQYVYLSIYFIDWIWRAKLVCYRCGAKDAARSLTSGMTCRNRKRHPTASPKRCWHSKTSAGTAGKKCKENVNPSRCREKRNTKLNLISNINFLFFFSF